MIDDVYKKNDIAYSAVINGRTVVLNTETGNFYHLDGVGCLIWQLLENPKTEDEIVAGVSSECAVPVSECKDDVIAFTDSLLIKNLIVKVTEV